MRRAEAVILTLGPLGEPRKTAALPQGSDAVAPAGEDFVRIRLMSDVPDQPVPRGVENRMQRDGQFDHAEARAEMPSGYRDRADRLGAEFIRNLTELVVRQFSQVIGSRECVQKGGRRIRRSHYWNTFARLHVGDNAAGGLLAATENTRSKNYTRQTLGAKMWHWQPNRPAKLALSDHFAYRMTN